LGFPRAGVTGRQQSEKGKAASVDTTQATDKSGMSLSILETQQILEIACRAAFGQYYNPSIDSVASWNVRSHSQKTEHVRPYKSRRSNPQASALWFPASGGENVQGTTPYVRPYKSRRSNLRASALPRIRNSRSLRENVQGTTIHNKLQNVQGTTQASA
jgi:hypothetical protein